MVLIVRGPVLSPANVAPEVRIGPPTYAGDFCGASELDCIRSALSPDSVISGGTPASPLHYPGRKDPSVSRGL
jgi:hypothetical protein